MLDVLAQLSPEPPTDPAAVPTWLVVSSMLGLLAALVWLGRWVREIARQLATGAIVARDVNEHEHTLAALADRSTAALEHSTAALEANTAVLQRVLGSPALQPTPDRR